MNDSQIRIASLSAERRKLFERWLKDDDLQTVVSGITPRQTKNGFYPLSFAQQRLWVLDSLFPDNPAYNENFAMYLKGLLNTSALRQSINEIICRHEVLRTTYHVIDGKPVQKINPTVLLDLPIIDLSNLGISSQEIRLKELIVEETRTLFILSEAPLIRAKLFCLADDNHVLLLTMHHICMDGWSMVVFYREMAALYEAFYNGRSSPLAELPIQYADYAIWQREQLQQECIERQLIYWRKQLRGPLPQITLPTDYVAPQQSSGYGHRLYQPLSSEQTADLRGFSRHHSVTLYQTLLTTFQILLHRYTGDTDIIVGSPIANRRQLETEFLIGFFVNTLVLRIDLSDDPSFTKLISRSREMALDADEHQDVPFDRLVEELQPERKLSHNPIFQVLFVMQNTEEIKGQMGNIDYAAEWVDGGSAKFAISLSVLELSRDIELQLEYSSDLFTEATAQRMLNHYQQLLSSAVAAPTHRLSELDMITEEERHKVIKGFNQTYSKYPKDFCLHHLFEQQAQLTPDSVAIEVRNEFLTYAKLDDRADRLASRLSKLGVGVESLVGVMAERSFQLVVALLGILKTGGAYVPLDPSYPHDRLRFMLEDSKAKVLLTEQSLKNRIDLEGIQTIILNPENETAGTPIKLRRNDISTQNLAYVIYTSGSTGTPKGAMNTHAAICNRLFWMQQIYNLTPSDVVLQKTPFSFDVSVWEFFWPLMTGARLILAEPEGHRDAVYLAQIVDERRVTTLHFVPSMLGFFLKAHKVYEGSSLHRVFCAGEPLNLQLLEHFFDSAPGVELHNLYGPTEAAIDVTYWKCQQNNIEGRILIGQPIANVQIYILDDENKPAAIGLPGEICLAGIGLGRGYWDRSWLTAEKFIPDSFAIEPGGRLYQTGDIGRWLLRGQIEYLKRMDHQVKIRGFRIELGEIESILRKYTYISEAVVTVKEDSDGDKRLIAYFVVDNCSGCDDHLTYSKIHEWLSNQLPDYMVPSVFVKLVSFPLTPNGKLDRKALPEPELSCLMELSDAMSPQTQTEEMVMKIWSGVLNKEITSTHMNFFEIGGHSLLAMQIVLRIRNTFQIDIMLSHFFKAPTINGLASQIEKLQSEQHTMMRMDLLEMLEQYSEEEIAAELTRKLRSSN